MILETMAYFFMENIKENIDLCLTMCYACGTIVSRGKGKPQNNAARR